MHVFILRGDYFEELTISRYKLYLQTVISFSLLAYLLFLIDWQQVREMGGWTVAVVMAGACSTLLMMTFQAGRWSFLIRRIGAGTFDFRKAYRGYLTGAFFSIFMPGAIGGDVIRIKYCADQCGIPLKTSSLVVATERVFGLAALCVYLFSGIAMGGVWLLRERFNSRDCIVFAVALLAGTILLTLLCRQTRLTPRSSFVMLLFSIASQGIDLLTAYAFLYFLYPTARFYWILIAMPLAFIATVLPISLGGLGVREGMMVAILSLFQVETSLAIMFSFMIYLSKIIPGAIGGLNMILHKEQILLHDRQAHN